MESKAQSTPAWRVKRVIESHITEVSRMIDGTQTERWDKIFHKELGISALQAWAILAREPDKGPQRTGD